MVFAYNYTTDKNDIGSPKMRIDFGAIKCVFLNNVIVLYICCISPHILYLLQN